MPRLWFWTIARVSDMAPLLPGVERLQQVAVEVAVAVAEAAVEDGVAPASTLATMRARVEACRWDPEYSPTTHEKGNGKAPT